MVGRVIPALCILNLLDATEYGGGAFFVGAPARRLSPQIGCAQMSTSGGFIVTRNAPLRAAVTACSSTDCSYI